MNTGDPDLTYHGNLVDELYGTVFGPDDLGRYVTPEHCSYDTLQNITDVWLRWLPLEEVALTVFDEHGQRRLPLPQSAVE